MVVNIYKVATSMVATSMEEAYVNISSALPRQRECLSSTRDYGQEHTMRD
jgi:hypothetical protein